MVDTLSRRYTFLATLGSQILRLENICEFYLHDPYFAFIYNDCQTQSQGGFYVSNGYLFKEMHEGGLMGNFGIAKTLAMLKENFFWPHIRKEIQIYYISCLTCLHAKSSAMLACLYNPMPIACIPWRT